MDNKPQFRLGTTQAGGLRTYADAIAYVKNTDSKPLLSVTWKSGERIMLAHFKRKPNQQAFYADLRRHGVESRQYVSYHIADVRQFLQDEGKL